MFKFNSQSLIGRWQKWPTYLSTGEKLKRHAIECFSPLIFYSSHERFTLSKSRTGHSVYIYIYLKVVNKLVKLHPWPCQRKNPSVRHYVYLFLHLNLGQRRGRAAKFEAVKTWRVPRLTVAMLCYAICNVPFHLHQVFISDVWLRHAFPIGHLTLP